MLKKEEINRYLKHHPEVSEETIDIKNVEFWVNNYPVVTYVSKRDVSKFMEKMNHVLCKAGIDMTGAIQDFNYYKKIWSEKETCKSFVQKAIEIAELYSINIGISQNDNEAVIILKDFAQGEINKA